MLVYRGVIPSIKSACTHLWKWVDRGTVKVKCLAQEHNANVPNIRARTRATRSAGQRALHWNVSWLLIDSKADNKQASAGKMQIKEITMATSPQVTSPCHTKLLVENKRAYLNTGPSTNQETIGRGQINSKKNVNVNLRSNTGSACPITRARGSW